MYKTIYIHYLNFVSGLILFSLIFIGNYKIQGFSVYFFVWFIVVIYRYFLGISYGFKELFIQCVYMCVCFISIVIGISSSESYYLVFFQIILFVNLYPLLAMLANSKDKKGFFYSFVFISIFFLVGILILGEGRGSFLFGPNQMYRIFGVLFLLSLFANTNTNGVINKKFQIVIFIISSIGLFLTGSRGGTIILILILCIFLWYILPKGKRVVFFLLTAFFVVMWMFMNWQWIELLLGRLVYFDLNNGSETYRLNALYKVVAFFKEESSQGILFGVTNINKYFPFSNEGGYPHNIFFEIIIYHGIILFSFFIAMLLHFGSKVIMSKYKFLYLSFIPIFIGSMFSGDISDNLVVFSIALFPFWLENSIVYKK